MENLLIRPANTKDLEGLIELESICFTTDLLSRKNFQHYLMGNSAKIYVAAAGKKIIGSLVIFFRKNSKKARMYSLAVHSDYRSQGIAAKLCRHMEKAARLRGCEILRLEVNTRNHAAIKFYDKSGYVIFAERKNFYEDGTNAFRMQKNLKGSAN